MTGDILNISNTPGSDLMKQISDTNHKRYALSVVSGQESMVVDNLIERVKKYSLSEDTIDFMVPVIPEVHIKVHPSTKKKMKVVKEKKLYPGYVFVHTRMNDKIRYVIRNTPGVRLIVGSEIHPIPLTQAEVDEIHNKVARETTDSSQELMMPSALRVGDLVQITEGEFENISGVATAIDYEKGTVDIRVEMLGRQVPVTVAFEKISLLS